MESEKKEDSADALSRMLWALLQTGDTSVLQTLMRAAVPKEKPDGSRE